jgi:hypothetical protein
MNDRINLEDLEKYARHGFRIYGRRYRQLTTEELVRWHRAKVDGLLPDARIRPCHDSFETLWRAYCEVQRLPVVLVRTRRKTALIVIDMPELPSSLSSWLYNSAQWGEAVDSLFARWHAHTRKLTRAERRKGCGGTVFFAFPYVLRPDAEHLAREMLAVIQAELQLTSTKGTEQAEVLH